MFVKENPDRKKKQFQVHNTRLRYNILPIKVIHDYFENSFFPSGKSKWNKLDFHIRNPARLNTFKKNLLNFIQPCLNRIFDIKKKFVNFIQPC